MSESPTDRLLDARWVAFLSGRKLYRDGSTCPPNQWTDDEWAEPCTEEMCRHLGWIAERGATLMRQTRIRQWAEEDGAL